MPDEIKKKITENAQAPKRMRGDEVDAANVVHWFRADRPEQHRRLLDSMPALPLFALLRRFTLARLRRPAVRTQPMRTAVR
jgi:hypothetical protein